MKTTTPKSSPESIVPAVHLEFIQNHLQNPTASGLESVEQYHRSLFLHHHAVEWEKYRQQARIHEDRIAFLEDQLKNTDLGLSARTRLVPVTVDGQEDTKPNCPWNTWDVLMFATDGVWSRKKLDLPKPQDTGTDIDVASKDEEGKPVTIHKPLGGWETKEFKKGVFCVRPGIYFPLSPTPEEIEKVRARGLGRRVLYESRLDYLRVEQVQVGVEVRAPHAVRAPHVGFGQRNVGRARRHSVTLRTGGGGSRYASPAQWSALLSGRRRRSRNPRCQSPA